jgi:hypothetical protein
MKSTSRRSKRKREWASSSVYFTRQSIIERTYHRTINRALHRDYHTINRSLHPDYHKLTPHRPFKCSQHRTSMSTCHRISKAQSDATHNLRITTVASPPSPHSSHFPTISHWWIIKVNTRRTTKPFEPIHSDMCGPFSTPASAGHHYYILCINDYTCYTFVWVLANKMSKICTSAYHTDIKENARKRMRDRECEIENTLNSIYNSAIKSLLQLTFTANPPLRTLTTDPRAERKEELT